MSLDVVPGGNFNDEPEDVASGSGGVEAPPGSPLSDLHKRIEENRRSRVLDLPVPGLGDIIVRFNPIGSDTLADIANKYGKRSKGEGTNPGLLADCETLIHACAGIFQEVDERLVSIDPEDRDGAYIDLETNEVVGDPLTFKSERLSVLMRLEHGSAIRNVRKLYATDGDVHSTTRRVVTGAGYANDEGLEERIRGN